MPEDGIWEARVEAPTAGGSHWQNDDTFGIDYENRKIYLLDNHIDGRIWEIDLIHGTETNLDAGPSPRNKNEPGLAYYEGKVYAFAGNDFPIGGGAAVASDTTRVYDVSTGGAWTTVAPVPYVAPVTQYANPAAVVHKDRIYLLGANQAAASQKVYRYNPAADT